jgi:hypothetical protein
MGVDVLDIAGGLNRPVGAKAGEGADAFAPAGNASPVFADWPVWLARLALALLAALLVAAAVVPVAKQGSRSPWSGPVEGPIETASRPGAAAKPYDEDIALYEVAIARIARGENYYDFIVPEQRARNYPVNPAIAVRLPTLAYLDAWLGTAGQIVAAIALMLGIIAAWWRKLGEAGVSPRLRRMATALVFVGASLGLNRHYFPLHELWAGGLIALAFGLHRTGERGQDGRWYGAFAAAALALAIREHTLPFVLLLAATALWQRNWREAAAWSALVAMFLVALAWHLTLVSQQILPSDPHSAPWLVLRGLSGWLSNVVQSSNLRWLPHWLSGPAVILMTFGWLGWNRKEGVFAFLLAAGYGVLFMAAGRWNNFYWGAMLAPVLFAGIAFAPRALGGLVAAARIAKSPVNTVNRHP